MSRRWPRKNGSSRWSVWRSEFVSYGLMRCSQRCDSIANQAQMLPNRISLTQINLRLATIETLILSIVGNSSSRLPLHRIRIWQCHDRVNCYPRNILTFARCVVISPRGEKSLCEGRSSKFKVSLIDSILLEKRFRSRQHRQIYPGRRPRKFSRAFPISIAEKLFACIGRSVHEWWGFFPNEILFPSTFKSSWQVFIYDMSFRRGERLFIQQYENTDNNCVEIQCSLGRFSIDEIYRIDCRDLLFIDDVRYLFSTSHCLSVAIYIYEFLLCSVLSNLLRPAIVWYLRINRLDLIWRRCWLLHVSRRVARKSHSVLPYEWHAGVWFGWSDGNFSRKQRRRNGENERRKKKLRPPTVSIWPAIVRPARITCRANFV